MKSLAAEVVTLWGRLTHRVTARKKLVGRLSIYSGLRVSTIILILLAFAGLASAASIQQLDSGWEFYQGSLGSAWEIWRGDKATDNVTWTPVTLPHCFNARDSVDPDMHYYQGPGAVPIEQITGSSVLDLHQDAQGSSRLLTSSSGAVVGTYSYDAYGNVTSHTGGASTPLQYDGQYTDAATGLQYLHARY